MQTMKGSTIGSGMRLMPRDVEVVAAVVTWRVLSRQQLIALGYFASKTRANAVLLRLVRFGYLSRRYQPSVAGTQRALYFPGIAAAALLHESAGTLAHQRSRTKQLSDLFLAHQLQVNDVRMRFARLTQPVRMIRWLDEQALRLLDLGLVPDGYVEYGDHEKKFGAFLELDRGTESLERWAQKVRAYLQLTTTERHRTTLGRKYFRVLAICPGTQRLEHLRRATARQTDRLFWFADLSSVLAKGPLARIWLRPQGLERHELTEP